jgi:flagellar biosynthesis/type III secretory pathway M-ring protein FliF/YscJ
MKNINFKRNESVLKGLEIQTKGKTKGKVNWDRIIYFALLVVVLILFFLFIIK